MTGRMSNNLLVHFEEDTSLVGTICQVRLDECRGFYYMGNESRIKTGMGISDKRCRCIISVTDDAKDYVKTKKSTATVFYFTV